MKYPTISKLLLSGLVLISAAASANAYTSYTTQNVNLRTGPGTQFQSVATLASGLKVEVLSCEPSWCRVVGKGVKGWVSSGYLEKAIVHRPIVVVRPVITRPIIIMRPPHHGHHPRPMRPKCKIAPGFQCK